MLKEKNENRKKKKIKKTKKITGFFKSKRPLSIFILQLIFTLVFFLVIIDNIEPKKVNVRIGDTAPYEIRATRDIPDNGATEKLKNEAMDRVEPRFRVNPSIQMEMKNDIRVFFGTVKDVKSYENLSFSKKANLLKEQSNIKLPEKHYNTCIRIENKQLNNLETVIFDIINQIMSAGIKEEELEYELGNVTSIFESIDMGKDQKELGLALIETTIKPNKFLDVEATQRKKAEEAEKIEPIIVKEDQVIVRKGDKINSNSYDLIKESGLLKEKDGYEFSTIIGTMIIILLVQAIVGLYLYHFNKEVIYSSKLIILDIIIISVILISEGVYSISPYMMPISAAAMLITLIINPKLALIVNLILSFLMGVIMGADDSVVAMLIVGGSIGVFSVLNASQRYNIFFNGLTIGIVNVLTIVSFGLIKKADILETLMKSGYGVLNGVFCAVLTIGTLPLWENVFQVLTPLKLLELSNPNQPLLKKLLLEAPGTYYHSVLVGNLSEAAAEAIGANPLITRVGAYYHDIGKLKRPFFFKENQLGFDNPHDKINPSLSTLIITNHVKDGLAMAEEHNLPKQIKDIIVEHHGDTFVAFFYYKALKGENGDNVKIEDFRYKGPKPQTKEAAIIMLADSSEAAVRSIKEPNKGKIEEMVRSVIKTKLEDGQLEECDLTLKDLNTIANIFCTVLLGIFHDRIEYPKLDLKEVKEEI
ncbi:HD family phosphohydrolase [Anaerosalibacter sp. Marseille-P3206]|uniref:HD family phosphohydrolase n=1 Tax=Anaerosalibacter sp. Marseille-P3206 TaxID=1871005 RepID=UPI000987BE7A|nr:HDIG domain-containing metalloprotein [Anaerosalibacter sp. Marseille-P3206]